MQLRRTILLAVAVCAVGIVASAPLSAQAPGYPPVDTRGIMAAYHAEVLDKLNKLMERWGEDWAKDKVDHLAETYWENAALIPPGGTPVRGRDAIREYLTRTLPTDEKAEIFMLDFDAGGSMAYVYGNYQITEGGTVHSGSVITVYTSRGRTWKIRSQTFVPS